MYILIVSFLLENEAMEIHSPVPGHCIDHSVGNDYPADLPGRSEGGRHER